MSFHAPSSFESALMIFISSILRCYWPRITQSPVNLPAFCSFNERLLKLMNLITYNHAFIPPSLGQLQFLVLEVQQQCFPCGLLWPRLWLRLIIHYWQSLKSSSVATYLWRTDPSLFYVFVFPTFLYHPSCRKIRMVYIVPPLTNYIRSEISASSSQCS